MTNLSGRLAKLEARHTPTNRVLTVFGANAEHQEQIAEVETVIGKLNPNDLTVCIRTFGTVVRKPPLVNGQPLETFA